MLQRTVVVERTTGMKKEVGVADGVHAAMRQQRADMFFEFLTDSERVVELVHQVFLFCRETIWTGGIDGGKVTTAHRVILAVYGTDPSFIINMVEEVAVLHLPFRATIEDGSFFFELHDGNGLVHLSSQLACLFVHLIAWQYLWHEFFAGVVMIGVKSKGGQRNKIDAVFLNGGKVGIA